MVPRSAGFAARTLGLLRRNPDFTRVYLAQLLSFGGDWFTTVALLGLVLQTTHDPALAGLMHATQTLPTALAAPVAGVVADRVDRRTLMVATDLLRAVLVALLLVVRSPETLWVAFVLVAAISFLGAFFEPASVAALPNLVAPEDLPQANVLVGAAWGTMLAVGGALGGAVVSLFGRDAAFVIDALSYGVSAALVASVRAPFQERGSASRPPGASLLADIRETLGYARQDVRVLALLVVKGGFGISGGVLALLSVFSVEVFGRGDAGIGLLMSARGIGALLGPFLFLRWVGGSEPRLFVAISVAFVLFGVCYEGVALAPSFPLVALLVLLAHMGSGADWTLSSYGLQRFTPDALRGRVFGFDYALITLTLSASMLVAGVGARQVGPRPVAAALGGVALAWALAWTLWTRARGLGRREVHPV